MHGDGSGRKDSLSRRVRPLPRWHVSGLITTPSLGSSLRSAVGSAGSPRVAADFAQFADRLARGAPLPKLQEDPNAHAFMLPLIHSRLYDALRTMAHPPASGRMRE